MHDAIAKGIKAIVFITDNLDDLENVIIENVSVPAMFILELDSVLLWDVWAGHTGRLVELRLDTSLYDARKKEMIIFWTVLSLFVIIYVSLVHVSQSEIFDV